MKILIVKLSAIGDVIHTLPALNSLRRHFPDAHITWLVEEAAFPIVEGHRALNRVLVSKRKQWMKELKSRENSIGKILAFIKELRDTRYDMIIDFQALLKSGMLIALARGNRKIGFDRGMEHMEESHIFLNERVPPVSMERHALLRYLSLLEGIGIDSDEIVYDIPVDASHREKAENLMGGLDTGKPFAAVNPMAKWETKLWYNDRFSELADNLAEKYDANILFTGSREDRPAVEDIISGMKHPAANLAGETDLKTLAAVYEKTEFLVTTDTGPMHLAAAVGTPVAAIFGPTAPWRTGPFGSGHKVIRKSVPCGPCFKRLCETKACMNKISVGDVMDGVETIADKSRKAANR